MLRTHTVLIAQYVLVIGGLIIQFAGIYITYRGYRQGWNHLEPSDRFVGPMIRALDKLHWRVRTFVRKALRRPGRTVTVHAEMAGATGLAGSATVVAVHHLPKIDESLPLGDQLTLITERMNKTLSKIGEIEGMLKSEVQRIESESKTRRDEVTEAERVKFEAERATQISTLRVEAFGFLVITVGAVLQGIGSIFGIN